MSTEVLHEMNGLLAEQVDAFAAVIEQRDLARDVAVQLEQETARLREALQRVREEHGRNRWHPDTSFPTDAAKEWHNGYICAAAHFSLIASGALDPEGLAEQEHLNEIAAHGSDVDWYKATGHCGRCSLVASCCECMGECDCWSAHGVPLEPYTPPELLRAKVARLERELSAYRDQELPLGATAEAQR